MLLLSILLVPLALASEAGHEGGAGHEGAGPGIAGGEFYDTARTLEPGRLALHPLLLPSIYGVAPGIDLKSCVLCFIGGPQVGAEFALLRGEEVAVSVEPSAGMNWSRDTISLLGLARYSRELGHDELNVGLGAEYLIKRTRKVEVDGTEIDTFEETEGELEVPVELGLDLSVSDGDGTVWKLEAEMFTLATVGGDPRGFVGANWNHAFNQRLRMTLGVDLLVGEFPETGIRSVDEELPDLPVWPVPRIAIWWLL